MHADKRSERITCTGSDAIGADYIPEKDYKAAYWMKNFALQLPNDPAGYRTSVEDAEEIDELVLTFRPANAPSIVRRRAA